jgi:2-oxoglutarate dehydrogenase E2 component (dihydrolipoamide succinyltransferase)
VARDEQIATIETDKVEFTHQIDVQVNSPEAGKVLELFAAVGDTVAVGGDLFKIELGEGGAATASAPPPPPKVEATPEPVRVTETPKAAPVPPPAPKPEVPAVKAEGKPDKSKPTEVQVPLVKGSRVERAVPCPN